MLDKYIVQHGSPTLAGIKTANLFTVTYESEEQLHNEIKVWNEQFSDKGVELVFLRKSRERALIYLCRKDLLQKDLLKPGVFEFLQKYGYKKNNAEYAIEKLKEHLEKSGGDFPHEIGIFLSYPLEDVIGFIENDGKNYKCSGCWKVYCDQCQAQKKFEQYDKCKDIYLRLWQQGRSLNQLIVAA